LSQSQNWTPIGGQIWKPIDTVRQVYEHVGSPKDTPYLEQRKALALRFRRKYGSNVNGAPNVSPFFIGVFDTVASLGSYRAAFLAFVGWLIFVGVLSAVVSFGQWIFPIAFVTTFWTLIALSVLIAGIWYVIDHLQYAIGLEGYSFWQTLHFTASKMQFYDKHLDNAVCYARHAISIDEDRADFARVEWASSSNSGPPRPDSYPDWLEQIWFAGVHSDIGGGYVAFRYHPGVDGSRSRKSARREHA
jgi:Uncharacterized alpha/beta hydrolase domain (DUF2235)